MCLKTSVKNTCTNKSFLLCIHQICIADCMDYQISTEISLSYFRWIIKWLIKPATYEEQEQNPVSCEYDLYCYGK